VSRFFITGTRDDTPPMPDWHCCCAWTLEKLEGTQGTIGQGGMIETTFCRRRSGYPCLRLAIWEVRCSVYIPIHQRPIILILLATFFYATRHVAGGRKGKKRGTVRLQNACLGRPSNTLIWAYIVFTSSPPEKGQRVPVIENRDRSHEDDATDYPTRAKQILA
jgi:hypothetical protein